MGKKGAEEFFRKLLRKAEIAKNPHLLETIAHVAQESKYLPPLMAIAEETQARIDKYADEIAVIPIGEFNNWMTFSQISELDLGKTHDELTHILNSNLAFNKSPPKESPELAKYTVGIENIELIIKGKYYDNINTSTIYRI